MLVARRSRRQVLAKNRRRFTPKSGRLVTNLWLALRIPVIQNRYRQSPVGDVGDGRKVSQASSQDSDSNALQFETGGPGSISRLSQFRPARDRTKWKAGDDVRPDRRI